MTPDQALSILIQAAELAPLPKREHVGVEQAAQVLRQHLDDKDQADAAPSPK